MAKISENIRAARDTIVTNPFGTFAKDVRDQSIDAIFAGIDNGNAWRTYMNNFSVNAQQLTRLCGEDDTFNNDPHGWSKQILAYIVASGVCGGGTGMSMADAMPDSLKSVLDGGIDNTPDGNHELSHELAPFLPA